MPYAAIAHAGLRDDCLLSQYCQLSQCVTLILLRHFISNYFGKSFVTK